MIHPLITACLAALASAVPTPNAGPDQYVTVPHDQDPATFTHQTLLNGSAVDPNGDPLTHHWNCPTATQVPVGCITHRLQLNNYGGANGHPHIAYNDTCEPTYDGNTDGGARPFGGNQIMQTTTAVHSTDAVTWVLLPAGSHTCTLTSTDSYGGQATDNVTINVADEPNTTPVANAGHDQNVTVPHDTDVTAGSMLSHLEGNPHDGLPEHDYKRNPTGFASQRTAQTKWAQVLLNASASYDLDGDPMRFKWACQGSGINTTDEQTYIWLSSDAKDGQTYLERSNSYTCCDGLSGTTDIGCPDDGGTATTCALYCDSQENCKSVGATVCSKLPQCASISVNADQTQVTLRSDMPDCTMGGSELQCTKPPLVKKTRWVHRCNLTVEDSYGATSMDSTDITVHTEPNSVPVANAGPDQTVTTPHDGDKSTDTVVVTLDGSSSFDADQDRLDAYWSCQIGNGNVYVTSTDLVTKVPLQSPASGWHWNKCTLRVTDTYGAFHEDEVKFKTYAEPNARPVANAGPNQGYTIPHDSDPNTNTVVVTLNGASSSDADGDDLTYHWSCPSASVSSTDMVTTVPMIQGSHACTLTVTDTYGAGFHATGEKTDSVTITVAAEPNNTPAANAGPDQTVQIPHDGRIFTNTVRVTLDASGTTDGDGDHLDYQWSCPSAGVTSTGVVTVVPMLAGAHTCTVTVTDPYGPSFPTSTGQHADTVVITVVAEQNMGFP